MIYRKDIEPRCAYCARAARINDDESVCERKGVVKAGHHCRAFRYDPFSRVPPKQTSLLKDAIPAAEFRLD